MKAILTSMKLALPAAFLLLLAGCITDPYQYRGGYGGDYYYGRPSVDVRHYGGYYGYGDPYFGRSGWSFGMRYGYPYGYGRYGYGGGYGYGYGGWPYYPPVVVRPGPDPETGHDPTPDADPQGPPPWRDLDRLRSGGVNPPIQLEPRMPRQTSQPPLIARPDMGGTGRPTATRAPRPRVEAPSRPTGGTRMQRVKRAIEDRDER
ncbi:MAG TPA: hypothetical protein VFM73_00140 [Xanthomonadaceae bacterium]|nr:hypothetical protein [Xanthomonadaceae bacterium]